MPEIHHRYGGSTFKRTLGCPAWRKLSDQMPPSGSSTFADEGTMLHNCAEEYFTSGVDGATMDEMLKEGRGYGSSELTEDLLHNKLKPAVNAVVKFMASKDMTPFSDLNKHYMVEPFVELIEGQAGGSIDMLAVTPDGKDVYVIDYKFGHNFVPPEENPQLLFYALCASVDPATWHFFDNAVRLHLVIVQPTAEETWNEWEAPISVLDDFELKAYDAIDACEAEGSETDVRAGDHCQYCPAMSVCPAKTGEIQTLNRLNPALVPDLIKILDMAPSIEKLIAEARKVAHEQLEEGVQLEGWKLVDKRASRSWSRNTIDELTEKAKKDRKLKHDDVFDTKIKSPAQLEKVCKAKGVDFSKYAEYSVSISSGTTLAPESDKRPASLSTKALQGLRNRLEV